MPRRTIAAAKPARSPITPPPSAIDQVAALDPGREQRLGDLFETGIGLRRFAFRDDDARGRDAGLGKRTLGLLQPGLPRCGR